MHQPAGAKLAPAAATGRSTMPSPLTHLVFSAVMLAATPLAAAPTEAVSGEGSNAPPVLCEKGFAYSPERQACISLASGQFEDRELLVQARALARAERYTAALEMLDAIQVKDDADVLTMLGFVKRKTGHFDEGMAHYYQALAIDPRNPDTREYLGEGYVETGRLDLARGELQALERICGTDCRQYRDLAEAIAGRSRK
jgi:tetratricopeptide (TPR) repeat protein